MSEDNQKDKHLDDLNKVFTGAVGNFFNAKSDISKMIKEKVDNLLSQCDVVKRDEYLVLKESFNKLLAENESLKLRIEKLENKANK